MTVQNPAQGFGGLSIEDMEKLKNLLGSMDKLATKPDTQASSQGRCSLTLSGKEPISLGLNALGDEFRNAWILDSGATDHMTHSSNHFKTYTPCPSSRKSSSRGVIFWGRNDRLLFFLASGLSKENP